MTKYLLDTTALIDYVRGITPTLLLLKRLGQEGHRLGVCCITAGELYAGVRPQERTVAETLLGALEYFETDMEASKLAGSFKYDFARRGVTLSLQDTLIAAVALRENAVLLTKNVDDFPEPGLNVQTHG